MDVANDKLYIGTPSGLSIYDLASDRFTTREPSSSFISKEIRALALDAAAGKLYIGIGGGLGGHGGLSIYDLTSDTFATRKVSDGLASNDVQTLALDRIHGKLYIGGGLSIYDLASDTFATRTVKDGLASNGVRSLALDVTADKLYIGTSFGLSIYHIDYDGDGIINVEELDVYGTNPAMADTDSDGLLDGDGIKAGTDPLDPLDPIIQVSSLESSFLVGLVVSALLVGLVLLRSRRKRI